VQLDLIIIAKRGGYPALCVLGRGFAERIFCYDQNLPAFCQLYSRT
jgi:hypothetical protein